MYGRRNPFLTARQSLHFCLSVYSLEYNKVGGEVSERRLHGKERIYHRLAITALKWFQSSNKYFGSLTKFNFPHLVFIFISLT